MERKKYRRSKGVQIPGIHIKKKRKAGCTCERIKGAAAVMKKVWGIGKRRFGGNWGRRL